MCKAIKCLKLEDIKDIYKDYDAIAIDEGQFFTDILEMCEEMANNGKHIIVAGLDGTFERKPFGKLINLVAVAEKVTKLTSICAYCYNLASFTQRTTKSKEVELIGGEETYRPVCRKCFFEETRETRTASSSPKSESKEDFIHTEVV